jgi:hypothetical protein
LRALDFFRSHCDFSETRGAAAARNGASDMTIVAISRCENENAAQIARRRFGIPRT